MPRLRCGPFRPFLWAASPVSLSQWGVRHGPKDLQPTDAGRWRGRGRDGRDIVVARGGGGELGRESAAYGPGRRCGAPTEDVRREVAERRAGLRLREGQGLDPRPPHRAERGRHGPHRVREPHRRRRQPPRPRRRLRHRQRRHPDEQESRRARRHPDVHLAHPRPARPQGRHLRAGECGLLALPRPRRRHGPRHRRHPQGAVRAGRRAPQGRHPARPDLHGRLQRHDDQQQDGPQQRQLRGHGG